MHEIGQQLQIPAAMGKIQGVGTKSPRKLVSRIRNGRRLQKSHPFFMKQSAYSSTKK